MRSIRRQMQVSVTVIALFLTLLIAILTFFSVNRIINQNRLELASSFLLEYATAFDDALEEVTKPADFISAQIDSRFESLKARNQSTDIRAWLPYFDQALAYRNVPSTLVTHIDFYVIEPDTSLSTLTAHYKPNSQQARFEKGEIVLESISPEILNVTQTMLKNGTDDYWITFDALSNNESTLKSWSKIKIFRYYNQPVMVAIFSGDASSFHINLNETRQDESPQLAILSQSGSLIFSSPNFDSSLLSASLNSRTLLDPASGKAIQISDAPNRKEQLLAHVLSNAWQILYVYHPKTWLGTMGSDLPIFITLLVIFGFLVLLLGSVAFRYFDKPLLSLEQSLNGVLSGPLPQADTSTNGHHSKDEIAQLMKAYQQLSDYLKHSEEDLVALKFNLEKQAQQKSKEIAEANILLTRSIEDIERQSLHLKELHDKLSFNVHTINDSRRELLNLEKMSSLKYLVSGVAHELNTPIGNAITIATYLDSEVEFLLTQLGLGNQLKKKRLTESVKTIRTSLHQLISNLQQAISILSLIDELSLSDRENLTTDIEIPAFIDILVTSYLNAHHLDALLDFKVHLSAPYIHTEPEKIRQIITPLIENSFVHGFKSLTSRAEIQIGLYSENGYLVIEYADNGCGVDWKEKQHILTPFYSSDFGLRKGLGLNFVYNIVTHYYKGRLSFFDTPLGGLGLRCELNDLTLFNRADVLKEEVST